MITKKYLLCLGFILSLSLQSSWAQCGGLNPCSAVCFSNTTTFPFVCNSAFVNSLFISPCINAGVTSENTQYFRFQPSGTSVSFVINNGFCSQNQGIQSAIMSYVTCSDTSTFVQVSNCFNPIPPGTSETVSATGLIPNQKCLLVIDGYAGDQCDFSINTDASSLTSLETITTTIATTGNNTPCKGTSQKFYVPNIFDTYFWNVIPPPAGIVAGSPNQPYTTILWQKSFMGTSAKVCLNAQSSCNTTSPICYDVTFNSLATVNDTLKICALDLPYTYTIPYPNAKPQKVEIKDLIAPVSNNVLKFVDSINSCSGRVDLNLTIKQNATLKGGVLLVDETDTLHVGTATNYKVVSCADATGFPITVGDIEPYPDCSGGVEYDVRCVKVLYETTILMDTSTCTYGSGKILCTAAGSPIPSLGISTGIISYLWSGPGIVGDKTGSSIKFNQYGDYSVTVSYQYSEDDKTKTVQVVKKMTVDKSIYNPNALNGKFFVDTIFYQIPKLVKKVFENDKNITISNVLYKGKPTCIGWYDAKESDLGSSSGIYLNTGDIFQTAQPATVLMQTSNGIDGEPDLAQALNAPDIKDPTVLEMDIVSKKDTTLILDYIFASEEYQFSVNESSYNDGFACLVSGAGYAPKTNIALVPNTNFPITTSSINGSTNVGYYKDNSQSSTIAYAGKTVPLQAKFLVKKDSTYHIKLGIADQVDYLYDSGVFLSMSSLGGNSTLRPLPNFTIEQNSQEISVQDITLYASKWIWDFGDGTPQYWGRNPPYHNYTKTGEYIITLFCENFCCCESISKKIVVDKICNLLPLNLEIITPTCTGDKNGQISTLSNPNLSYLWSNGSTTPSISNLAAGQYTLTVSAADGCKQTATTTIEDPLPIEINIAEVKNPNCTSISNGYIVLEGNLPYSYVWNTGEIGPILNGVGVGTYTAIAQNKLGCKDTITVTLSAPVGISIDAPTILPDFGKSEGSISLGNITGVSGGYAIEWSNGAIDLTTIKNLKTGTYTVTITDVTGCSTSQIYIVPLQVSTKTLEDLGIFIQLNPNPSAIDDPIYLTVKATSIHHNAQCTIFDYAGKKISNQSVTLYPTARIPVPVPNQSGVFLLQLQLENGEQQTWRLVRK